MGVCRLNICFQVAAFVITFNVICNMTMLMKKFNFALLSPPTGSMGGGGSAGKISATVLLHS